ncbi:MAG: hypothetical protein FWF12_04020 [Betaproteobacteria bacterium]|nr:hypothetical protein [Betaproteobacteria bacterium]
MESRITVIGSELKSAFYNNKAGGAPREVKTNICKVILHMENGVVDVGTLRVPESLAPEGVQPGDYMISYRAGRGFSDDAIGGVMCGFKAVKPQSVVTPTQKEAKSA